MQQGTRGRLVAAIFAVGLVGGLVLGGPSALAQPEPPPLPPARAAASAAAFAASSILWKAVTTASIWLVKLAKLMAENPAKHFRSPKSCNG